MNPRVRVQGIPARDGASPNPSPKRQRGFNGPQSMPVGRASALTSLALRARMPRAAGFVMLALLATTLPGCSEPPAPEPEKLTAKVERGPFRLDVAVWPTEPQVGDVIRLEMSAHTPDDYAVQFPDDASLDAFEVVSSRDDDPKPSAEGGLDWRHALELESYLSGEIDIPPLAIKYGPRPDDDGQTLEAENELVTESIKLVVRSALTPQEAGQPPIDTLMRKNLGSPSNAPTQYPVVRWGGEEIVTTRPRDISGTLMPPRPPLSAWQWAGIVVGALTGLSVIIGGIWWLYRLSQRPAPPIPAEVIARRALDEVAGSEWLEPQRIRECHYRLSEIVRVYVENKFGLGAPEMTTEEFLRTLASISKATIPAGFVRKLPQAGSDLDRPDALHVLHAQSDAMRVFMEACDIVKYGALTPEPDEARHTIETAREFVNTTAAEVEHARHRADQPQVQGGRAA